MSTRPAGLAGMHTSQRCPKCFSTAIDPVVDGDEVNFLCRVCGRCWHIELGYVHRVDPRTCGGCPHRPECLARQE